MLATSSTSGRSEDRPGLAIPKASGAGTTTKKIRQRAPRACLNCRDLKIKCEQVGDGTICARCKVENKKCVFVSSRRGGQNKHKHSRQTGGDANGNSVGMNNDHGKDGSGIGRGNGRGSGGGSGGNVGGNGANMVSGESDKVKRPLEQTQGSLDEFRYISSTIGDGTLLDTGQVGFKKPKTSRKSSGGSIGGGGSSGAGGIGGAGSGGAGGNGNRAGSGSVSRAGRAGSTSSTGSIGSGSGDKESTQLRRQSEEISLRRIQNPSDSLNLLAQAAFNDDSGESADNKPGEGDGMPGGEKHKKQSIEGHNLDATSPFTNDSKSPRNSKSSPISPGLLNDRLGKFCLVERGIVSPITLKTLISTYFTRHHQYMPVMPAHKILRSDSELCAFAESEPILVVTFVIIASRFEDDKVHFASWEFMSEVIQELVLGIRKPTLGTIEAFLTLSENVPKFKAVNDKELYEFEERFSWNLVGQAVRMSYYLGLDQKTLLETDETMSEEVHRMRFIWTFCYFEECQTSIRFGRALWSRGPTLCFPSPYDNYSFSSFRNLRTLIPSASSSEDHSSYMQALIDSTNIMSNIHDLLYPSRDRTISLVHLGDYHKILDEFTMAFANYKMTWEKKYWEIVSLNETVWVSFNYARLYAYGFAFEAHMKRMTESCENLEPGNMFPMSMMATADAKFIIEAKIAAVKILTSCADNLRTYGAMAYLPARYYGYFSHSAVFLIKLIFTGAINFDEQKEILDLIGRVIACFCEEFKGLDRHHPLIRCAQQLRTLLQTLWPTKGQQYPGNNNKAVPDAIAEIPYNQEQTQNDPLVENPLAGHIFNLVDNFSFDIFSPDTIRDSAEFAFQDLAATFSNDLNSDFWLSYIN